MSVELDTIRRRLLWRATHRGIKEMDVIIGGFAQAHIASMHSAALAEFSAILEIPDQELLSWMTKESRIPADRQSPLLARMLAYRAEPQS